METAQSGKNSKAGAIRFAMLTAGFLTVVKLGVGIATQSMGVVASAVDSLMDVLVSTVNFISLREAEKPADHDHAYGHGKIESLAGLFQSLIITVSGLYLIYESAKRVIQGQVILHLDTAIGVMVVSMGATYLLIRRLQSALAKSESIIVSTEKLHYSTDLLTGGGVILALVLVRWTGQPIWDLAIAIAIAVYILKQSFRILRHSVDELIDRALPEETQAEIRRIVLGYDPRVLGIHNLRTRKIGETKFIEFHVELRKDLGFEEAHDLTETLITEIEKRFPGADVNAHFDPEGGR